MGLEKSIGEWTKFSFTGWLKDRGTLKYFLSLIIIFVLTTIAGNYLIYSLLYPAYSSATPSSAEIVSAMINAIPVLAVFIILNSLAVYFIAYLVIARALKLKKNGAQKLSFIRLVKLLVLELFIFFSAFLSLFNPKFLMVLIAAIVLFIVGVVLVTVPGYFAVGGALLVLGFVLLLAYFIVVAYNSIRLLLSTVAFVEKNLGIVGAAKESWKRAQGNVLNIAIAWLVLIVISFTISAVSAIPATIYSIYYSAVNSAASTVSSTAAELAMTTDIGYMIAMIPTYIFSAFLSIAAWFYMVSIYTGIKKSK